MNDAYKNREMHISEIVIFDRKYPGDSLVQEENYMKLTEVYIEKIAEKGAEGFILDLAENSISHELRS